MDGILKSGMKIVSLATRLDLGLDEAATANQRVGRVKAGLDKIERN